MDIGRARMIAKDLMDYAGLKDWNLYLHKGRRHTGRSSNPYEYISLSVHHVLEHSENDIIETVLHEIGHALSPKRGHGREWAYTVAGLGGNPRRLYVEETR